jgi:hypothetical protein
MLIKKLVHHMILMRIIVINQKSVFSLFLVVKKTQFKHKLLSSHQVTAPSMESIALQMTL